MAGRPTSMFRNLFLALRAAVRPGGPSMMTRVVSLPRMVRAMLRRDYTGAGPTQLALMLGALVYLVSPLDALPEALLGPLGLLDDAVVVAWLAAGLVTVTEDFLGWESRRGFATQSGPHVGGAVGTPVTVPSSLVR